jgi:hypothetical protein
MRLRHLIPAGLLDAGCASLATFAIGLVAARTLSPTLLGVYALFFTAFILGAVVPTELLLIPAEVMGLSRRGPDRLAVWRWMLRRGAVASALSGMAVAGAAMLFSDQGITTSVLWLAATMVGACSLSPLQDHLRRVLHLAGLSWRASGVSVVQLTAVVMAIALLRLLGAPPAAVPFGALALGNVVSLSAAIALARVRSGAPPGPKPATSLLTTSGRWLLLTSAVPAATSFLVAALITRLAGADQLGFAEAARLVAQPLYVLATGFGAVLGPRAMEAGRARVRAQADATARPFVALLLVLGVGYLAVMATDAAFNPMARLLPNAYQLPWLTTAMVAATLLHGVSNPFRQELIGGRRERSVSAAEGGASLFHLIAATSARYVGAYARPAALAVYALTLLGGLLAIRRRHYRH